jgi:hypothetical protein
MLKKVFGKRTSKKDVSAQEQEEISQPFQERPWVCLIDTDTNVGDALISAGLNCTVGSLGPCIALPNRALHDSVVCRLNNNLPENLHEYDIIIIDMEDKKLAEFDPAQHAPSAGTATKQMLFDCPFPQSIFDPRPIRSWFLKDIISEIQRKKSIIIVFASRHNEIEYNLVS